MSGLSAGDALKMFWRSLWLQAAWSYEGMQTLGFAHALEPALARAYPEPRARCEALARHMGLFNTHPFLASTIIGCAARMELAGDPEGALAVKKSLMGPFGGLGDSIFWGALKPLLVLMAMAAVYRGWTHAVWAFVAAFALCNVAARGFFFWLGYRRGREAVVVIHKLRLLAASHALKGLAAVVLGYLVWVSMHAGLLAGWGIPPWVAAGAALTLVFGMGWLVRRGLEPMWLVWLVAAGALWTGRIG